jgi:hypothetical protein
VTDFTLFRQQKGSLFCCGCVRQELAMSRREQMQQKSGIEGLRV